MKTGYLITRLAEPVACIRSFKRALAYRASMNSSGGIEEMPWARCTEIIRRAVYERDARDCVCCGNPVTWAGMHMHERQPRGKGGLISLENSETRCAKCHNPSGQFGPSGAHGNRRPQFGLGRRHNGRE